MYLRCEYNSYQPGGDIHRQEGHIIGFTNDCDDETYAIIRMPDGRVAVKAVASVTIPDPELPESSSVEGDLVSNLLSIVARETRVSSASILGDGRTNKVARARQLCYYLLRQRGWSFEDIARALHRTNHGTVMHGCRVIEDERDTYKTVLETIEEQMKRSGL